MGSFGVQYVTSPSFEKIEKNKPKHVIIVKLARFLSYWYKQLKYIVRIIVAVLLGGEGD